MSEREIGLEILEGLREIKAFKEGKANLVTRRFNEPVHPKMIRNQLELSQIEFARLMGVSVRTVQDWEQNRRQPSGPAKSLLRVAEQYPEVFLKLT